MVTAGQAFHWFDHEHAVSEMRRVLRPGGRVGLLWNLRDDTVEWVRRLLEVIGSEDAMTSTLGRRDEMGAAIKDKLRTRDAFGTVEQRVFDHQQELTEEGLVSLIASRSYVAVLPEEDRRSVLSGARALRREHLQLRDRTSFVLPHKTRALRAEVKK